MPSTPYYPRKRALSTVIPIVSRISGGPIIPVERITSRVQSPGSIINTSQVSEYNTSAVFSGSTTLACPALVLNTSVALSTKLTLSTFPTSFTVASGGTASVIVAASLAPNQVLPSTVIVSSIAAGYVYGVNTTPTLGSLIPGILYTLSAVSVMITVVSLGSSTSAFSIQLLIQAHLSGAVQ